MNKKTINYAVLVILILITSWIILSNSELQNLPRLLLMTNKNYILLGVLAMFANWLMNSAILQSIAKIINTKFSFLKALKITMIGQYYSAITPFASGGQPAQIYHMKNDAFTIGKATSILIIKFIIYQIVVTFYSLVMFAFKLKFISSQISMALPFVVIGITISCLGIFLILSLFFNQKLIKKVLVFFLKLAKRLKLLKDLEKSQKKADHHLEEYMACINKIKKSKLQAIWVFVLTLLQLTFYFSITYFVYRALGFSQARFIEILAIQSLLYMAVSFIPTPGAVGVSEGGFHILFKVFFSKNVLVYAMVLWRIISYYLSILLGGLTTFIDHLLLTKKNSKN